MHLFMMNEAETFYRINKLREISTESLLNEITFRRGWVGTLSKPHSIYLVSSQSGEEASESEIFL